MIDFTPYVQRALLELSQRTDPQIHAETACTWAGRALAKLHLADQHSGSDRARLIAQAVVFAHEAKEHASSAPRDVQDAVEQVLLLESPVLFGGL